jgi:hypothetical protein
MRSASTEDASAKKVMNLSRNGASVSCLLHIFEFNILFRHKRVLVGEVSFTFCLQQFGWLISMRMQSWLGWKWLELL